MIGVPYDKRSNRERTKIGPMHLFVHRAGFGGDYTGMSSQGRSFMGVWVSISRWASVR